MVYHIYPTDIFWGASWTSRDLSQITGHKLFLPVPMRAQGLVPGQPGEPPAHTVLPAAFREHLKQAWVSLFPSSNEKKKPKPKKHKGGKQPDFILLPLLNPGVLDQDTAVFTWGSTLAGSVEGWGLCWIWKTFLCYLR